MKRYSYLLLILIALFTTSCLKSNLEELPLFETSTITTVRQVAYRYVSSDVSNASGQNIVKFVVLTNKATIDANAKTVGIVVTVPAASTAFPDSERAKCSTSNLAIIVTPSTAATIKPLNGAPELGIPGDWSKANTYRVTAADGTYSDWVITITAFNK